MLDIGTNTVLLLVVRCREGEPLALDEALEMPRLGEGAASGEPLRPAAVERTLQSIAALAARARRAGAERIVAVATAAVRDARSDGGFLERAAVLLGQPVKVLSEREEAEATARGALSGLSGVGSGPVAVLDVGGGSTEVARLEGRRIVEARSVPVGAVRLAERFLAHDPPTLAERCAVLDAAREALAAMPLADAQLVAVAGTATTLAALDLGLAEYDPHRVHGHRMALPVVQVWFERLAGLPLERRRALPGMDPRRADVVVAGVALVLEALRATGRTEMMVSDRGVRWGVARALCQGPAVPVSSSSRA